MYESEIRQLLNQLAWTDDVTYYHSLRVGYLLARFAETDAGKGFLKQAWVTRNECVAAGLLHEIGKIVWPRELLCSSEAFQNMDHETLLQLWTYKIQHPLVSENMVLEFYQTTGNRFWQRIAQGVGAHHENYGGGGYPYGRKGLDIPLLARGIRIVESYVAITEVRRYRNPLSPEMAIKELKASLGCFFDPYWGEQILHFLQDVKMCADLDRWLDEELSRGAY